MTMSQHETDDRLAPDAAARLVENHRRFLAFVEKRVSSRAVAEEVLQDAYVRGIERGASLRDDESAVAWFYRLLRNALTDHYRRHAAERRALDAAAREPEPVGAPAPDAELMTTVCGCIASLVEDLEPTYADAIRSVDLEERRVADFAVDRGITANAASVRLHRARKALARQLQRACRTCATHGCVDCTCPPAA